MTQILTVFGATGMQGGSVIRTVLAHPVLSKKFSIRAVTRDPSKPAAQALAKSGVEVVKADLGDKASVAAAVNGSHSVFAVTNFWETMSKETEVQQGRNVADAALSAGVKHLIWSALPNATKLSSGALTHIPHFDGKAEVDEYIRKIGVPVTSFFPGFYMTNLKSMMPKGEDGNYTLAWPVAETVKFPLFEAAGDTGKFVAAALLHPETHMGGKLYGASGWYTGEEIVKTFKEASGKEAKYAELPPDVWKSFLPAPVAQEMLENLMLIRDFKYFGPDKAEEEVTRAVKALDEPPTSLKAFMEKEAPW